MENKLVKCEKLNISNSNPFVLIAGPCQLENEKHALDVAEKLKTITQKLNIGLIYKTSFDKANRTSLKGKRGVGLEKSLPIFDKIRKEIKIPVQGGMDPKVLLTDKENLKKQIKKYLDIFKDHPYIFNLGHGVLPETDPNMMDYLVKTVKDY